MQKRSVILLKGHCGAKIDFRLNDDMAVISSLLRKEKKKNAEREYKDRKKQLAPSITEAVSVPYYIMVVSF